MLYLQYFSVSMNEGFFEINNVNTLSISLLYKDYNTIS